MRSRFPNRILPVVCILLMSGCAREQTPLEIESMIKAQLAMYPEMLEQDWYKLFHQASMGSRHLGVDDSLIYNYLLGEWDRIEASNQEPLVEYIAPDSSMVRIHLRPYKAKGGTPEAVFEAMKKTWETFEPSENRLQELMDELLAVAGMERIGVQKEVLARLIETQKNTGFPPMHHSELYESKYKPAYRVIERQYIPEIAHTP